MSRSDEEEIKGKQFWFVLVAEWHQSLCWRFGFIV